MQRERRLYLILPPPRAEPSPVAAAFAKPVLRPRTS
jgi:hypothetical protein